MKLKPDNEKLNFLTTQSHFPENCPFGTVLFDCLGVLGVLFVATS